MTMQLVLTLIGIAMSLLAIVLVLVFREIDRAERVRVLEVGLREISSKCEAYLIDVSELNTRVKEHSKFVQAWPDLTMLAIPRWEFIRKILNYRAAKEGICKKIVNKYIHQNNTILLDSGSTVDLVAYELLKANRSGVFVYSNNVFAAVHLAGTRGIKFCLFHGIFNDRYAAVYSPEANNQIYTLHINVYILAATIFRSHAGVLVDQDDKENILFKQAIFDAFQNDLNSILIIAVDGSKFSENIDHHEGVLSPTKWIHLLQMHGSRIHIVTSCNGLEADRKEKCGKEVTQLRKLNRDLTVECIPEPDQQECAQSETGSNIRPNC